MNRRSFLKCASTGVASFWLAPLMYRKRSVAFAQEKPPLSESDSTAQELGYKEDNTKVDTTKFPKKAGEAGKNQKCSACKFYSTIDAKHGDCMIFVNNTVNANGWCSYWEQRA
jgi:high potential iron-sulfur protein